MASHGSLLGFGPVASSAVSDITLAAAAYTLTAGTGAFTWGGASATLTIARVLTAQAGAFTYAGADATITLAAAPLVHRTLEAGAGAFAWSGADAQIRKGRILSLEGGAFAWSGGDANLRVARVLHAGTGAFVFAGQPLETPDFWVIQPSDPTSWSPQDADPTAWAIQTPDPTDWTVQMTNSAFVIPLPTPTAPATVDAEQVTYTPYWPGGQTRTVRSRLMDGMSILDFIPPAEHAAILAGTSTWDCADAFDLAKAAVTVPGRGANVAGNRLYYPPGIYYHSRQLVVDKTMVIWGAGGMTGGAPASELIFPRNVGGMWIPCFHTSPTVVSGGNGSTIEHLTFRHLDNGLVGGDDPTAHGVFVQAKCNLKDLVILFFPGAGLKVTAYTGFAYPDPRFGNANVAHFEHIDIQGRLIGANCYSEYGYHCEGGDSNVISSIGINVTNVKRWCVYEKSAAGNTHVGAQAAYGGRNSACTFGGLTYYSIQDNNLNHQPDTSPTWWTAKAGMLVAPAWDVANTYQTGGPYKANEGALNGANLFLGCYSEGGQPPSVATVASIFLGGSHGAGFDDAQTGSGSGFIRGMTGGILAASRQFGIVNTPQWAGGNLTIALGGYSPGGLDGTLLSAAHPVEIPSTYRLKYDVASHNFMFQYANSASFIPYRVTGPVTTDQFGTGAAVPHQLWVTSIAIGITTNARRIFMNNVMPTSGTYAKGDRVFNMFPGIVGSAGSQYTVTGWLRMVTGTAHVLNTDWVEMRAPTGT